MRLSGAGRGPRGSRRARRAAAAGCLAAALIGGGCASPPAPPPVPQHLLLVTVDTLRADRVGAYGYAAARTPTLDRLARDGVRFDRAFTPAPITLTAHASLLTGRLPPAHGARHNGMAVGAALPTLATVLHDAGFATAAFVAAFPLDRRFGLARGFDVYGDRWPRGADGRPLDERPGRQVVDEALAWRRARSGVRTFVWVHLFEPHAPYGRAEDGRSVTERYDGEVAEADRQIGRLVDGLGERRADTLIVVAADHGEAFGEHGELGHSVFVYDTTLRVPLVVAGPGVAPRVVADPVGLVDLMPTVLGRLAVPAPPGDGLDLAPLIAGQPAADRALYAESFAPRFDFGWSGLRAIRQGGMKYIAAPRPELYDLAADPGETADLSAAQGAVARRLAAQVAAVSPAEVEASPRDAEALRRLQALGYVTSAKRPADAGADPKDRRELAARIAAVTSGEVRGAALEATLRAILDDDPANPQAHLRLAVVLADAGRCREAEPHFEAAIAARMPTADAHLGLAGCLAARQRADRAREVLAAGAVVEPDNPVILANQGLLLSDGGQPAQALPLLARAVELDPDLHQARFALAIALARTGDRSRAEAQTRELLQRLDSAAPQRPEVLRLLDALR